MKQEVPTRFNSRLNMYSSIRDALPGLRTILPKKGKQAMLYLIDSPHLSELIELMGPFEEASKVFSASHVPTLYQKVLWKVELKRLFKQKSSVTGGMSREARVVRNIL